MNLGSFKLFHAVKGAGVASPWGKMGDALDVEMKLAVLFGDLDKLRFFVELAIADARGATSSGVFLRYVSQSMWWILKATAVASGRQGRKGDSTSLQDAASMLSCRRYSFVRY